MNTEQNSNKTLSRKDSLRKKCWNQAFSSFGTGWLFEERVKKITPKLQWLTFLGIAVPVTVGTCVLSFGIEFKYLDFIIGLAGILIVIQLIVSLWSLVAKWNESLVYALESSSANYSDARKYEKLAENPPDIIEEYERKFELLEAKTQIRDREDIKQRITEKEKRAGYRAALRQFQRPCAECKKVPTSLTPSDCKICGDF